MATILLAGVDLFIRGKLEASLAGHHLVTSDSADPPDLVIADVARIDPYDVADEYPDVPLLGFTNHKDTAGLRRANEAGFDQVVAKSALDAQARELIDRLLPRPDPLDDLHHRRALHRIRPVLRGCCPVDCITVERILIIDPEYASTASRHDSC